MAEVKVTFNTDDINRSLDQVAQDVYNQRQDLLEVIGVQILSFAQEAYDVKATGAAGPDGIQWAPLQVATVLARLRRAGHLSSKPVGTAKPHKSIPVGKRQKNVLQVKRKVKGNEGLFDALSDAGLDFFDHKSGKKLTEGKRNKTKAVLAKREKNSLKNTVNVSGYDIGVDTGLQRASGSPGYRGGNQVFMKNEVGVTVGYNMAYSKHFDKRRKLLPDEMPPEWMEELELIVQGRTDVTLTDAFKKEGLS